MNRHLLIEPIKREAFIAQQNERYQEIGVVVNYDPFLAQVDSNLKNGDKVYFDAWLAAKYPKEGTTDEYFWLVQWENIRMIEHAE